MDVWKVWHCVAQPNEHDGIKCERWMVTYVFRYLPRQVSFSSRCFHEGPNPLDLVFLYEPL